MESLINSLMDPGSMNASQWLLISLVLFILVASCYLVYRLFKILQGTGKSTYKPNIGLSRVDTRPPSSRTETK